MRSDAVAAASTEASGAERVCRIDCADEVLWAVVSQPAVPTATGVVIVVGGPQYRVGSHRQFVQLARALMTGGFAVLRFDVRGMGDSVGEPRSFEHLDEDIAAAISALRRECPNVKRVALWGLCDGASAALMYMARRADPTVAALALANPWVRSTATLARARVRYYYWSRLTDPAFWRKLAGGGVGLGALREWFATWRQARAGGGMRAATKGEPFQATMARAWQTTRGPVLLLLSGRDETAREFEEAWRSDPHWHGAADRPGLLQVRLEAADHTFSDAAAQREAERATLDWLRRYVDSSAGPLRPAAGRPTGSAD